MCEVSLLNAFSVTEYPGIPGFVAENSIRVEVVGKYNLQESGCSDWIFDVSKEQFQSKGPSTVP